MGKSELLGKGHNMASDCPSSENQKVGELHVRKALRNCKGVTNKWPEVLGANSKHENNTKKIVTWPVLRDLS